MVALPEHRPRLPRLREDDPASEGSRHGGAHEGATWIPQPLHADSIEQMFARSQGWLFQPIGWLGGTDRGLARCVVPRARVLWGLSWTSTIPIDQAARSLLQTISKLTYFEACRHRSKGCSSSVRASGDW